MSLSSRYNFSKAVASVSSWYPPSCGFLQHCPPSPYFPHSNSHLAPDKVEEVLACSTATVRAPWVMERGAFDKMPSNGLLRVAMISQRTISPESLANNAFSYASLLSWCGVVFEWTTWGNSSKVDTVGTSCWRDLHMHWASCLSISHRSTKKLWTNSSLQTRNRNWMGL